LYWRFLDQHEATLKSNPRMAMQLKNLQRLAPDQRAAIAQQAQAHLSATGAPDPRWPQASKADTTLS
jgi:deoxyribodipyrimidine photolyase-related protein